MTTKIKIISGFVVMVIILGALAFLGYTGIQKSSTDFEEYRRLARQNVGLSDLQTALFESAANLFSFINTRDPKNVDAVDGILLRAKKNIEEIQVFAEKEASKQNYRQYFSDLETFSKVKQQVYQSIQDNARQYESTVMPTALDMIEALDSMTEHAYRVSNTLALKEISETGTGLAKVLSALSRFANSRRPEDAKTIKNYIGTVENSLHRLESVITTEEGIRTFNSILSAYKKLNDAFIKMNELSNITNTSLISLNTLLQNTLKTTNTHNDDINNRMLKAGEDTLERNNYTQNFVMTTSGIGVVVAIVISMFIVLGLIKVLLDLSHFAEAIAKGDFEYQLKVKEKGEIGNMIEALRNIPKVLEHIIDMANTLSNRISTGHLRERMDTSALPGAFSALGVAVNTVSAAYTDIVDNLPIPVMACDKSFIGTFYNKAGQQTVGGNHVNSPCKDHLRAPECSNDQCFGRQAMNRNSLVSNETEAYPQGKHMNVSVTAIPLYDKDKQTAGFIEIRMDLTEIKAKQAIMLQVAKEASDISDRVAAAAEELAAQVEEISRGAEVQRSRVESTASAMTEMNATVLEVARNAAQASEQSDNTRNKAKEGAHLVNQVVNAINDINKVGNTLHTNMQELGQQAESIGGVMNVISDIADQTNLLALNAAIEAARAGEAGRGFAVVADEVRKLAEKTMAATQEVGANISSIQHSARVNIDEVDTAVKSVGEATSLANSSGRALGEIVNLASANSAIVASIATAAEEQSATSEEINSAIDEVNRITGETTDGMVQSSEAVQELSRMAQELRRVMENLS